MKLRDFDAQMKTRLTLKPWIPPALFAGGATVVIVLFYWLKTPWLSNTLASIGIVLFGAFLYYVFRIRQQDTGSLGSTIPTLFGPILAQWFVTRRSAELTTVLHNGGDTLIQVTFFFSGLLGLLLYHLSTINEMDSSTPHVRSHAKQRSLVSMGLLIALLLYWGITPDFAPTRLAPGPTVFSSVESPGLSPLTFCRVALAIWSVLLATWKPLDRPSPTDPAQ